MTTSMKHLQRFLWAGILTQLSLGAIPAPSLAQAQTGPKQVLIIRHGEKPGDPGVDSPSDPRDLSTKGYERAGALAPYIPATFPKPDFLFATQASKHSNRPVETITPLSAALGLKIDSTYSNSEKDIGKLANDILHDPQYAGKHVLICWHHGTIPELAEALGVTPRPKKWAGDVFDLVWRLDYDSDGKVSRKVIPQMLLYGDSSE